MEEIFGFGVCDVKIQPNISRTFPVYLENCYLALPADGPYKVTCITYLYLNLETCGIRVLVLKLPVDIRVGVSLVYAMNTYPVGLFMVYVHYYHRYDPNRMLPFLKGGQVEYLNNVVGRLEQTSKLNMFSSLIFQKDPAIP